MNWYNLFKIADSGLIRLNLEPYKAKLKHYIDDLYRYALEQKEKLSNFKLDINYIQTTLLSFNYPRTNEVINYINNKDIEGLDDIISDIYNFAKNNKKDSGIIYKVSRYLYDYIGSLDKNNRVVSKEEYDKNYIDLVNKTKDNMGVIIDSIKSAIGRISNWNGSLVTVEASEPSSESYLEASVSAVIYVGDSRYAPLFSYFVNEDGSVEIDDIGEAEDEDFFSDKSIQSDYFNLIFEIRKPGSTSKSGKILTLYTARPIKDRSIYESTNEVPSGIFMTTNYNSVEGIASDLGGNEVRDIWRVRIDSRYLLNTLDSPGEKQYQVVGSGKVPVVKMELINPGKSR